MDMSIQEIVKKINGRTSGRPNSSISMVINFLDKNGNLLNEGMNHSAYKPEVIMTRLNKYTQIELNFKAALDNDLDMLWNILQNYGKLVREDREDYPLLSLTMVPNSETCEYFAVANNPIFWALSEDKINSTNASIKMCFEADDVIFYHADVNKRQLELELEKEIGIE